MLEKQGFVGLSTGGNGVLYVRPSAIMAIQEREEKHSRPELKSGVFLQGIPAPFLVQDNTTTIAQAIEAVENKKGQGA
ncbi:hypothetical protein [Marinobacter salarius]|uniref:hypothetical protein n=1 Tax=Marinobacter salarius TaxID=1420917 RepID=UPI00125A2C32|nr:hypothetical protein [Marinobacter salarius]VVT28171.1 conserved hypothetical protein [Marinobacter salarius]